MHVDSENSWVAWLQVGGLLSTGSRPVLPGTLPWNQVVAITLIENGES
jgi:hypothetical protein